VLCYADSSFAGCGVATVNNNATTSDFFSIVIPPRAARGGCSPMQPSALIAVASNTPRARSRLLDGSAAWLAWINVPAISAVRAIRQVGELIAVVGVVAIHAVAEPAIYRGIEALKGCMQHSTDADAQCDVDHVIEEAATIRKAG